MRQRKLAFGLLALLGVLLAPAVHAASPLDMPPVPFKAPLPSPVDDLVAPKPGNSACFTRVYDAAHLRKNPKQTTTAMAVWLSYDKATGAARSRAAGPRHRHQPAGGRAPFFAHGGCAWDEGVNRDVQDRRMIKEFKKEAGIACMMLARPDVFDVSSAEEGGF